jgi:hypothetical protein
MGLDQPMTGARNNVQLGLGKAISQLAGAARRRSRIGRASDDQRRAGDLFEKWAAVLAQLRARDRRDKPSIVGFDWISHKS